MCDTFFTHALLFLFLLSTYFVYLFSNFIYLRMLPSSPIAVTLDFEVLLILHGSELAGSNRDMCNNGKKEIGGQHGGRFN